MLIFRGMLITCKKEGNKVYKVYSNKYNLTVKENVFHAKKIIVQNIYNSAKLQGCNITFPETETILNRVNVPGISLNDIECIFNLRNAWRLLLKTVEEPLTLDYICKIHDEVARNDSLKWGTRRVDISGTSYVPPIPEKEEVVKQLQDILSLPTATSQAIYYFLYSTRSQLFWNGNKRTSTLIANKILISGGKGLFTVKESDLLEFNKLLSAYCHEGHFTQIDDFLYENCIVGY